MQRPRHRDAESRTPVDLPHERTANIAGDVTAAELDLDLAPFDRWKPQRTLVAFRGGGVVLYLTLTP